MRRTILISLFLALMLGSTAANSFAQKQEALQSGRKGQVHFTKSVCVGDVLLKAGMYQVQHVIDGENHVIVFKKVIMPAGYKMGGIWVGKEVVRIKCKVEPADKKFSNTKVFFITNAKGEKEIEKIQVAGEKFIHIFRH